MSEHIMAKNPTHGHNSPNSRPSKGNNPEKGAHYRVIKDSAKTGNISPKDAHSAAKNVKERRSSKS